MLKKDSTSKQASKLSAFKARITQSEAIAIVDSLKKKIGAKKAILFGSYARGDIHDFSDIDVVFIKETNEKKKLKRLDEVYDNYSGHLPLDAIVYTPEDFEKMKSECNPFIKRVLKEGVAV